MRASSTVRGGTGNGPSTNTSRRSGYVESQQRTVKTTTASMVEEIRKMLDAPSGDEHFGGRHFHLCVGAGGAGQHATVGREKRGELAQQPGYIAVGRDEFEVDDVE